MNKLAVSLFLIATTLLTIASTNGDSSQDRIIDVEPYSIVDNNNEIYLQKEQVTMKNSINSQKTIKIPIHIASKDRNDTKYLEIKEDSSLQEKIENVISVISSECFNGLSMKVTVYGKSTAKVELIEPKDPNNSTVSWKDDYLNEYTKEYTINTIIKNIIQEEYKGEWIDKVQLYYENELIQLD
jgi:hypothetical protein